MKEGKKNDEGRKEAVGNIRILKEGRKEDRIMKNTEGW